MRRVLPIAGALVLAVAVGVLMWNRVFKATVTITNSTLDTNADEAGGVAYGVSLYPQGSSAANFTEFVERARTAGTVLTWTGDAVELERSNGGPETVLGLAEQYGLTPVLLAGVDAPTLRTAEPAAVLRDRILDFVRTKKPPYLGLGNEINRWSEVDTDSFVRWFSDIVPRIHEASAGTKIFTTLQYENLQGRNDGLFGGKNDPSKARWNLLEQLTAADLFAFTSYPGLLYRNPAAIPDGYYAAIADHTDKPVAFTEVGWFRATSASGTGWESNSEEQAAFIRRFRTLLPTGTVFAVWPFVYDPEFVAEPFGTMGLLARDATDSPAWQAWVKP